MVENITTFIKLANITLKDIPPELVSKIADLMFILKAAGILFLIYILFLVVSTILNIKRNIRIKKIYEKVDQIDDKLNQMIKQNRKNKKD